MKKSTCCLFRICTLPKEKMAERWVKRSTENSGPPPSLVLVFSFTFSSFLHRFPMIQCNIYATCASPIMHLICPLKCCISMVFDFSWDGCNIQEKWKTKVIQNFVLKMRCITGDGQVTYNTICSIKRPLWCSGQNNRAVWFSPS